MIVDHDDLLDGPFAERAGVANDQSPAIIADHAREDLRRTGAELVDQDNERPVPGGPFVVIVEMLDAEDFLDLNDRAGVDEEAGERLGLFEQAAAVASKIEDDRVDALGLEVGQDPSAIAGRADRVAVAAEDRHGVAVERGQVDDADLEPFAIGRLAFDDLALGMLLLEFDLLAGDLVDPLFLGAVGLNDEPDLGSAADREFREPRR